MEKTNTFSCLAGSTLDLPGPLLTKTGPLFQEPVRHDALSNDNFLPTGQIHAGHRSGCEDHCAFSRTPPLTWSRTALLEEREVPTLYPLRASMSIAFHPVRI